jgi:hypothetical protein
MTKSFPIAAAVILAAPTAWAQVQNGGPQGSTGGNSVGVAINAPAPSVGAGGNVGASTPGANAGASTQVQNAGPAGSDRLQQCRSDPGDAHQSGAVDRHRHDPNGPYQVTARSSFESRAAAADDLRSRVAACLQRPCVTGGSEP